MALENLQEIIETTLEKCKKKTWHEIVLSKNLKAKLLKKIPKIVSLDEKTGTVSPGSENLIIFPYQFFFNIAEIKDVIFELNKYRNEYEKLSKYLAKEGIDDASFAKIILDLTANNLKDFNTLKPFSDREGGSFIIFTEWLEQNLTGIERDYFIKLLTDKPFRGGAKSIANAGNVLRTDWYSSIILKSINVPDTKSGYLGDLVEVISRDEALIREIVEEVNSTESQQNYANVLVDDTNLKQFVFKVFKFIVERKEVENLLFYEKRNTDPKFSSITYTTKTLTSIFWIFDHQAPETELTMGGKLRAHKDSILQKDGSYYYLSGEWADTGTTPLDFQDFKFIFNKIYKDKYRLDKIGTKYVLFLVKKYPLNQILYGPPGTGKTFNTINHALAVVKGYDLNELIKNGKNPSERKRKKDEFDQLIQAGQIQFVTFHQSYSYEEFVEGIKVKVNDNEQVYYETEDGIFKKLCLEAVANKTIIDSDSAINNFLKDVLKNENSLELETLDKSKFNTSVKDDTTLEVTLENSKKTNLSIPIRHIREYIASGNINKFYADYCIAIAEYIKSKYQFDETKIDNSTKNYVLIIDEINRGNISKIFGELITLIEDSKRLGKKDELKLKLTYSGSNLNEPLFGVPSNLYIIGTMNTADKSIALIDTALRRRFTFIEYTADPSVLSDNIEGINLQSLLSKLNERIEYLLDRDHLLGHAYFIDVDSKDKLCEVFRNKIIPLLSEYFYNDFEKIQWVLGDNNKQKKDKNLWLIKSENKKTQVEIFGKEIEGYDDKKIFSVNKDLTDGKYENIDPKVFKSIYDNTVSLDAAPVEAISEETVEEQTVE